MADDHLGMGKMTRGWLFPYLVALDNMWVPKLRVQGTGRWMYWLDACQRGVVPEDPIPQLDLAECPKAQADKEAVAHIKEVLNVYVRKGYWWDDAWLLFIRWLLHGFGRPGLEENVARIPVDVQNEWYEKFDLTFLLRKPAIDWSMFILGGMASWMKVRELRWAKTTGFFPTPMTVSIAMAKMTMAGGDTEKTKLAKTLDPCVGTGSLLLPASNYTLNLCGVDIVYDLVLCTELNGWLWMPWLVWRPLHMEPVLAGEVIEASFPSCIPIPAGTLHADSLSGRILSPIQPPPVYLETDPGKVALTRSYRQGELSQAEFFGAIEG